MSAEKKSQTSPDVANISDALVWIDCEMTGLNPDTDEILEIYCIITNGNLDIIDPEGFHAVIHWPRSRLDEMDEWCTNTHRSTGLTAAVLDSTTTPSQAADALYDYVTKLIPTKRTALLAGSSVHADRAFLRREPFSKVTDHLHYRILDISSIKEAARRWSPAFVVANVPKKIGIHKARDDILESINEAKYYRDVIFRSESSG
ncbi:Oligoribonuclease [Cladobotryum mycophilum]|uniref:Oligoribonuclease n=1 Tax=Cladobotryum mycophilum TaxID=491253 RepID=A0ABR0SFB5_9HYPO